jgi:hypothetical protein
MERVKQSGLPRNSVPRLPRVEFFERSFMSGLPFMYELVMSYADASTHNGEERAVTSEPRILPSFIQSLKKPALVSMRAL